MKQQTNCVREHADTTQIERGKNILSQQLTTLDYLSTNLALVGNPVRLQILYLIHLEQKLCVCDLSDILGMTLSAVSQHLRKLKDRNFVDTQRQGQTIYYFLTREHMSLLTSLFQFLSVLNDEENN